MILSLGFSSRGVWVRLFMQTWFPLVPTAQSPALCHICLLYPFQSYLVSDGPSGSLSHPPPPGPRMPLPWPPMLLGRMQCRYWETQGIQSLQPFWASSGDGAANSLLEAAMVRHFFSGNTCSFHLEALSRCLSWDIRGQSWCPFKLTGFISLYKGLSKIFWITTVRSSVFFLPFTLSYGTDITSIHDYWKNHSFAPADLCSKVNLCF